MNGKDLLTGLGNIDPKFYEEAENEVLMRKKRTFHGTLSKILIAAAMISTLAVTASAAELGWFQRYFESRSAAPLSQTEAAFLAENEQPIYESQTRDGYTLTVKSAITDGRMAYINIGIRGPEDAVLSKTVIPGYNPAAPDLNAGNFGPDMFTSDQDANTGGSGSLITLEDFDGLDNTQDWLLTVERSGQQHFTPGKIWNLHIEDLVATYQNEEYREELNKKSGSEPGTLLSLTEEEYAKLNPKTVLAEGPWDFEIQFRECDTRTIELINDPVTAYSWEALEADSGKNVEVTSLTLSTLGAVICADTKFVPDFGCVSENQYVHVVMEDGSQIRLRPCSGMSGQQKLEAERPIMLDNVDYVLLADGTRLPMP